MSASQLTQRSTGEVEDRSGSAWAISSGSSAVDGLDGSRMASPAGEEPFAGTRSNGSLAPKAVDREPASTQPSDLTAVIRISAEISGASGLSSRFCPQRLSWYFRRLGVSSQPALALFLPLPRGENGSAEVSREGAALPSGLGTDTSWAYPLGGDAIQIDPRSPPRMRRLTGSGSRSRCPPRLSQPYRARRLDSRAAKPNGSNGLPGDPKDELTDLSCAGYY
jgi:hypothetical protein